MRYASGANYDVDIERGVVVCRVRRRPDLSREEGAACAQEKVGVLGQLACGPRPRARALVLDLSGAPSVWGPTTHQALRDIIQQWIDVARPAVVIVGTEAIQKLSVQRLMRECGSDVANVALSLSEGMARVSALATANRFASAG